jgi:hypothetical protein
MSEAKFSDIHFTPADWQLSEQKAVYQRECSMNPTLESSVGLRGFGNAHDNRPMMLPLLHTGSYRPKADCGQLPVQPHPLFSLNTIF